MIRKYGTLSGLILGVVSIFGSFLLEGGSFHTLFLWPALIIVFGGTFAATIISFGLDKFLRIFSLMQIAYFPPEYDIKKIIDFFTRISIKVRVSGLLSIEKDIEALEHHFTKKIVGYAIEGMDQDSVQSSAQLEMKMIQERHLENISIFNKMGGYAPTMGIIGTVMGLIMTLASAGQDPNKLIAHIATAFIATLWGIFSANIFWLPIGDKLKECHIREKNMMEISLEGVLAIQSGAIPSEIRARLMSLLPQREQIKMPNPI
ncbi:MAG: chemotaxis protein MotA [Chlorobiaceae bacterium]|nr:chemotaxis protein MotA [Chlorobiaceae bacterium]MBA4309097.1 chemotaxis protein MotA [Chlorobiaceae bacterium]